LRETEQPATPQRPFHTSTQGSHRGCRPPQRDSTMRKGLLRHPHHTARNLPKGRELADATATTERPPDHRAPPRASPVPPERTKSLVGTTPAHKLYPHRPRRTGQPRRGAVTSVPRSTKHSTRQWSAPSGSTRGGGEGGGSTGGRGGMGRWGGSRRGGSGGGGDREGSRWGGDGGGSRRGGGAGRGPVPSRRPAGW